MSQMKIELNYVNWISKNNAQGDWEIKGRVYGVRSFKGI